MLMEGTSGVYKVLAEEMPKEDTAADTEYVGVGAFRGLRRTESGPGLPRREGRLEGYT